MPQDPAVLLALITSVTSVVVMVVGFWNQQRVAEQNHRWDMEERARNTTKIIDGTERAYNEANHTKEQIIKLHEENNAMHKDIGAVLEVAKAVKHTTGQHQPLEKSDIAAVAEKVVQAIRATGPLTSSGD